MRCRLDKCAGNIEEDTGSNHLHAAKDVSDFGRSRLRHSTNHGAEHVDRRCERVAVERANGDGLVYDSKCAVQTLGGGHNKDSGEDECAVPVA